MSTSEKNFALRLLSKSTSTSTSNSTGIISQEIGPSGELPGRLPLAFARLALMSAATCRDSAVSVSTDSST